MWLEFEADASIVPQARERRRHRREDLCFKVRFEILEQDAARDVLDGLRRGRGEASLGGEWYAQNLSSGGLGLRGVVPGRSGCPLKEGDFLRIEISSPRARGCVRCVGEVAWVELQPEWGAFRAGVAFVGVNPEDLGRLMPDATDGSEPPER